MGEILIGAVIALGFFLLGRWDSRKSHEEALAAYRKGTQEVQSDTSKILEAVTQLHERSQEGLPKIPPLEPESPLDHVRRWFTMQMDEAFKDLPGIEASGLQIRPASIDPRTSVGEGLEVTPHPPPNSEDSPQGSGTQ